MVSHVGTTTDDDVRPFLSIRFLIDFVTDSWYVLPSEPDGRTYQESAVGLLLTECSTGGADLSIF